MIPPYLRPAPNPARMSIGEIEAALAMGQPIPPQRVEELCMELRATRLVLGHAHNALLAGTKKPENVAALASHADELVSDLVGIWGRP